MVAILPMEARGLTVRSAGLTLVGPLDCRIEGPGLTVLIGPNGAGKTTLLRALHGLERLSSGTVSWALPADQAQAAQAFVFQSPVMLRRRVVANLAYPLRLQGRPRADAARQAAEWADRLHLAALADRPASVLSRGERQRLALARALIRRPQVLFLDEPTASLDGASTLAIERLVAAERARGTAIVLATHDFGQVRRLADRVIFLLRGRIHEDAPAAAFLHSPSTPEAKAFLDGDILS
jgi:tungstate transport system ATP-binding protein